MDGSPGDEEDETDSGQQDISSSSPGQLPLSSLAVFILIQIQGLTHR